jgi:hypothetical protein
MQKKMRQQWFQIRKIPEELSQPMFTSFGPLLGSDSTFC